MSTVAICLYSKYSQRCKEFMDEMGEDLDIQMISIDNQKIRETVLRDSQGYHVKTVPCIFLLYGNGRLEKYEGSDAFVWLRKVKEALEEPSPSKSEVQQEEVSQPLVIPTDEEEEPEQAVAVKTQVGKMLESQNQLRQQGTDQIMTKKQENIKDLAQAMQRQREEEDDQVSNNAPSTAVLPINRP